LIPRKPVSPEESAKIMTKLRPIIESFEKARRDQA